MATAMRIIETPILFDGGRKHVFVFCLARSEYPRISDIIQELDGPNAPQGVIQVSQDDAGPLVYFDNSVDGLRFCRTVVEVINRVLERDYVVGTGSDDQPRSVWFASNYGDSTGSTKLAQLMGNSAFRLPYMMD
jgi:hypothetical protein